MTLQQGCNKVGTGMPQGYHRATTIAKIVTTELQQGYNRVMTKYISPPVYIYMELGYIHIYLTHY